MQRLRQILRWKYAVVVVAILIASLFVSSQYQKARGQCEQKCAQFNNGVVTPSVHAENCDECERDVEMHLPGWYRAFIWPDGITAWAIILTLMTIAEQTRETRRSAIATEKTVRLMRGSSAQWLELEPYGLFTQTEVGQPDPPTIVTINPRWKIANNTPLPLTLKTVEVRIAIDSEAWEVYSFDFNELISPAKNDNFRSFFVPFKLNTQQTARFLNDLVELSIAIKAVFVGVSRQEEEQFFGDIYICKLGHLEINYPIGKSPQRQHTEKDENPTTLVEERGFRTLEGVDTVRPKRT
jgi:hypothetical protein